MLAGEGNGSALDHRRSCSSRNPSAPRCPATPVGLRREVVALPFCRARCSARVPGSEEGAIHEAERAVALLLVAKDAAFAPTFSVNSRASASSWARRRRRSINSSRS
jgi:hypothetical protein